MTTATLRVVTVDHTFTDNVVFRHNDENNSTNVTIRDTVSTGLQAAFDELVTNTTIVDLRIFNSGTAPTANYIQTGTIRSAELTSVQTKLETSQIDSYLLTFTLQ